MYRIGKTFRFEAGHSLPGLPEGHKCKRPHGHSYQVQVVLEGELLTPDGFVRDYAELDGFKEAIVNTYDHRDLNTILGIPTTAENLAAHFFGLASLLLPADDDPRRNHVRVAEVTVKETESTFATYVRDVL